MIVGQSQRPSVSGVWIQAVHREKFGIRHGCYMILSNEESFSLK